MLFKPTFNPISGSGSFIKDHNLKLNEIKEISDDHYVLLFRDDKYMEVTGFKTSKECFALVKETSKSEPQGPSNDLSGSNYRTVYERTSKPLVDTKEKEAFTQTIEEFIAINTLKHR